MSDSRKDKLRILNDEIEDCTRCRLHKKRITPVCGDGPARAQLVIIGEGPGRDEDYQGKPFVGLSGKELSKQLKEVGIEREKQYITNVVKCRPPNNRRPAPDEIEKCSRFLKRELSIIKPRGIITLGMTAALVFKPAELVGGFFERGKISKFRGGALRFDEGYMLNTWHPSYILRKRDKRHLVIADMQKLLRKLSEEE